MTESVIIREVQDRDREAIVRIFNHYAVNGFAAYPEQQVTERFFPFLRDGILSFYVLETPEGVIGFGLTKPFLPFPAFSGTCMLTYFIAPGYLNRGFGSRLLDTLTRDAQEMGLSMMVANMASRNEASIRFHKKHGFEEAGRLHNVGVKFGEPFDVIWMQKTL